MLTNTQIETLAFFYIVFSGAVLFMLVAATTQRDGERGITYVSRVVVGGVGWPLAVVYLIAAELPAFARWLVQPKEADNDEVEEEEVPAE